MTEERIIAYLLGVMPEDERERFEEECFSNEDWPEELGRVEEELVEDYLRGELTPEQSRLFKLNYLTTTDRQERFVGSAAMLRYADEQQATPRSFTAATPVEPVSVGWWRGLWGGRPWAGAAAAVLVIMFVGGLAWWFARPRSPAAVALALNVSRSDRAAGPDEGRVKIPSGARELRITLTLPDGSAQAARYRAELVSDDGEVKPSEVVGQDARTVSIVTPVAQLPRGRYALKLFAVEPGGAERRVSGTYFFMVE